MNLKKNNIKIATILPYKENYTHDKASAASLWVADFFKNSKFRKNNIIFGHTKSKNFLTNNYKNIKLNNIKSKLRSTTNEYVENLINQLNSNQVDIIEIHNRPLLLIKLSKKIKNNFIFYFHNDPLSMKGSKTVQQRLFILASVKKIIFVSEWVKKRFFHNLDIKLDSKTEIVYPSVNPVKPKKKEKYIIFVGRLNHAKGYDLYKNAIIKILNEFPKWSALSVGDEDRRSIYIKHKNHKELGFLNYKKTLELFNESEIAVVPSRWEEPFGRTSLEATSCGCATIISNSGGLGETTDNAIVLKKNNSHEIYKEIKKLIIYPSVKKKIQRISRKKIKHLIADNTILLDQIRESCILTNNFNIIYKKLKIINLYNLGQKLNYRLYNISLGKKFTNGFIRNNHDVLEISDRDYIRNNKYFNLFPDKNKFQNFLIETFKNYNPDLLFFGHTNNIDLNTLRTFRELNKNLIISQWNEDPVMPKLKYSNQNIKNIKLYSDIVDHNFITTDPSVLKNNFYNKNFHFFFVPVDNNIERFNVFKMNPKNDFFYAMSHGVNRAKLKEGTEDSRIIFLNKLVKKISNVKYDFYGFANKQPIWGNDFNNAIINCKMGLNLSRGNPTRYYSSNRIASIMGNGLLTFVDQKVYMDRFFNKNEIIFYSDIDDLADKIIFYSKNNELRKKIAKEGKSKYFKLFNERLIGKFLIDVSLGKNLSLIN